MTDEEKAEEYLKKNKICNNENWEVGGTYCYALSKQAYLDGLAEGRKEKCLEQNKDGTIRPCEVMKENEQWKQEWQDSQTKANEEGYARTTLQIKYKELEKENEQLKKEISILLSCSNCSENKGGYICEKEYNDKCLAQKIEYIKELKEEIENYQLAENESKEIIAELKAQIEKMKNYCDCEYCINVISGDEFTVENTNKTICEYCMENNKKLWELAK